MMERMTPTMKKKLIDTLDSIADFFAQDSLGIFQTIADIDNQTNLVWLTDAYAYELDKSYYLVHSGQKWISKQFEDFIEYKEKGYIVNFLPELAKIIQSKFELSWNKIYDAITTAYKPLENYDMEQKETPDVTNTKTIKQSITTENDAYGFNSGSAVPTNQSTTSGLVTDNEEKNKETGSRTLTRHGNIGVTTSQQMLIAELDLRSQYNFENQLFDDVDSILCLLTY